MGKLWDIEGKSVNKVRDRNVSFLSKKSFSDLPQKIEKRCFWLVGELQEDTAICIDEVDINKEYAKVMEWLSYVRDGSTWKIVQGYMFHWASINGIPVILEHEDFSKTTKWLVFYSMVDRICHHTKWKGIFLLDRLYDVGHYFNYLHESKASFIIRVKKNRTLIDAETGQSFVTWNICEDTIQQVYLPDYPDIPLHLHVQWKYKENGDKAYKEPLRVLTDVQAVHAVQRYLDRWEIEQVFRTMKQQYNLEKIRVHSLQVIKNMVACIQLSVAIANAVYNRDSKFRTPKMFSSLTLFEKKFAVFAKRNGLTMNRSSICTFISYIMEKTYRYPLYPPQRITRNHHPYNKRQLSLFQMVFD